MILIEEHKPPAFILRTLLITLRETVGRDDTRKIDNIDITKAIIHTCAEHDQDTIGYHFIHVEGHNRSLQIMLELLEFAMSLVQDNLGNVVIMLTKVNDHTDLEGAKAAIRQVLPRSKNGPPTIGKSDVFHSHLEHSLLSVPAADKVVALYNALQQPAPCTRGEDAVCKHLKLRENDVEVVCRDLVALLPDVPPVKVRTSTPSSYRMSLMC